MSTGLAVASPPKILMILLSLVAMAWLVVGLCFEFDSLTILGLVETLLEPLATLLEALNWFLQDILSLD